MEKFTQEEKEKLLELKKLVKELNSERKQISEKIDKCKKEFNDILYQASRKGLCEADVREGYHSHKCNRKSGYGKDGNYCKQHAKKYPAED